MNAPSLGLAPALASAGRALVGGILAALLLAAPAVAADDAAPVTLSGSARWTLHNAAGHAYQILISLPEGDAPPSGGYPVLYVLDANAYFASFHEAKRAQKQYRQAIVVGIAYPGSAPLNFLRRSYDFSPPDATGRDQPPQGGQDELLDFIEHRLMPAVAKAFPVDARRQGLFGHSFGGMFALYALFTRPGLFDHTVAASPSLWWSDGYLLTHERQFRHRAATGGVQLVNTSVALVVAADDSPQDVGNARALQQRLADLSQFGLRSSYRVEADENHMSLPFRITSRVLAEVLRSRRH